MNALHLLWIIPLTFAIGFSWGALMSNAKHDDDYFKCLDETMEGYE